MLAVVKIAAVGISFGAPVIPVVCPASPNRRYARAQLVGRSSPAATATASARVTEYILYRKILFVDVVCLSQQGDLLITVKPVEIYAFIVVLVRTGARHQFAKITLLRVLLRNNIQGLDSVPIVNSREFALVAEIVKNLDLVNDIRRQVSRRQLGVVIEKPFPIHHHALNGFALRSDITA